MKEKVAIVGHGVHRWQIDGGRGWEWNVPAPFRDLSYEVWGMNALYTQFPSYGDTHYPEEVCRYDRWFQLHTPEYMAEHWSEGWVGHEKWLQRDHPFPVYMQQHYPEYPASVTYPREEVEKLTPFGAYQTSTMSWQVAYAILCGFKRIELWGIDCGPGEPHAGRPCLEYWLGVAHGQGIEIHIEEPTDLIKTVHIAKLESRLRYGYEREPARELGDGWKDMR